MKNNFKLQVLNPVADGILYEEVIFIERVTEDNTSFGITSTKNGHEVKISAEDEETYNKILVRVVEELTEDAFYSAFPELNKNITPAELDTIAEVVLGGLEIDTIKSQIRYDILVGFGVFKKQ